MSVVFQLTNYTSRFTDLCVECVDRIWIGLHADAGRRDLGHLAAVRIEATGRAIPYNDGKGEYRRGGRGGSGPPQRPEYIGSTDIGSSWKIRVFE